MRPIGTRLLSLMCQFDLQGILKFFPQGFYRKDLQAPNDQIGATNEHEEPTDIKPIEGNRSWEKQSQVEASNPLGSDEGANRSTIFEENRDHSKKVANELEEHDEEVKSLDNHFEDEDDDY